MSRNAPIGRRADSPRMSSFSTARPFRSGPRHRRTLDRRVTSAWAATVEALENRLVLSFPPLPIVPASGESQILQNANKFEQNGNLTSLDNLPIPFAVVATQIGGTPVVMHNNPGSSAPSRVDIDVDNNPATGKGGKDIGVSVSTELFLNGVFNPHLIATYDRLGTAPFASNYEVLVSFPFAGFNAEVLPGGSNPNLFMGFKTTGAAGPDAPGGIAPLQEQIRLVPNVQAGANHLVDLRFNTTAPSNPMQFITGFFDGTNLTGVLDAAAFAAWVQAPPASINVGVGVSNSGIFAGNINGTIKLDWTATAPTKTVFDYLEEEDGNLTDSDFDTKVTFDQMPTSESLTLKIDEAAKTFTVKHRANAKIGKIEVLSKRNDGLKIVGTLSDVPKEFDLSLGLGGTATLDVSPIGAAAGAHDNTMDLKVEVTKTGGFLNTSDFLGYNLGYAAISGNDLPDLTAGYLPATDSYGVKATNPGESIGYVELAIDDDAHYGAIVDGVVMDDADGDGVPNGPYTGVVANTPVVAGLVKADLDDDGTFESNFNGTLAGIPVIDGKFDVNHSGGVNTADDLASFLLGLATPPSYFEGLPGIPGTLHHLFSVVDDGTHGTAIARIVRVQEATLDLDADATEAFHMVLGAPSAPMQGYLRFLPTSNIVPGHDIEITCDIDNVPFGVFDIHFDGPGKFGYTTDPPQTIDSIHCYGHIDTLNFDVDAGGLPPVFDFDFDPDSHVYVFAQDGHGGAANIGHVAARFWDEDGPTGLPGSGGLLGTPLRDAQMRVDDIPSSHADWGQVQGVAYDGGSGTLPVPGDILYDPATGATAKVLQSVGGPASGTLTVGQTLGGVFNDNNALDVLDSLAFTNQTKGFGLLQVITGATSGATATIQRVNQLGGAGVLFVRDVSGAFQNGEDLKVNGEVIAKASGTLHIAPTFAALVNGTPADKGAVMDFNTDATDVFLGGVQFKVSTQVEFDTPLPVADPDADDFAFLDETDTVDGPVQRLGGGAFGIDSFHLDTFASINLHYDANDAHQLNVGVHRKFDGAFFPASANFQYDLGLVVDAIPQEFDFSSDLATQFAYKASDPINSVTLIGTIDDSNDSVDNGAAVQLGLTGLPSEVRFGYIADEVKIVNGLVDVNRSGGVSNADDGKLAGVVVIDGLLDLNGDGSVTAADDGRYFGIPVIDGKLDVVPTGTVDGDDDGALAGAEIKGNGNINVAGFSATSVSPAKGVFNSDYRIISALVDDIPATLTLSYGGLGSPGLSSRFLLETRDAFDNPLPLGSINALVSTTSDAMANNDKAKPFTLDGPVQGGAVLGGASGGSRINYSPFLQEIDKRYYNAGAQVDPSQVLTSLRELYADSEQLDAGEDHLLVRQEDPDGSGGGDDALGFASFQFTKFQHLSWTPDPDGGEFAFAAPGRGNKSFFAGFESDDDYTTLNVEHIPDSIIIDLDKTEHLVYTANASPGEIDFYNGPGTDAGGLFANDGDDATRAVLRNTPSSVRIFWNFSFPNGGAFVDSSNPFQLLFLTQDAGNRITAGASLEDLHLGWGIDILSLRVTKSIEIWNPFGDNFVIPIAFSLLEAKVGIDNDADNLTLANVGSVSEIGANNSKASVAGFFALYDMLDGGPDADDSPQPLNPGGPAPAAAEYVPLITVETEGFREFSLDLLVELDPTNPGADLYPIDLELTSTLTGNLNFDVWSSADIHFTDNDDIPFIPEVGFVNPPDYTNNSPFHIMPGLLPFPDGTIANGLKGIHIAIPDTWVITFDGWHTFNEHFDPFAGTPAPFTGSSGDGGFDGGDLAFEVSTLGAFNGALARWQDALVASGMDPDDAANLINDVAANTDIHVGHFTGTKIGDSSGDSTGATINIDPDAGGFEWFNDPTPFDDAEFASGGPAPADLTATAAAAQGKVDMVTFFLHEIGHILGFDHATIGVMIATLPRGVRRLPVGDDATADPPGDPAPAGDDVAALHVDDSDDSLLTDDATLLG